jgi:diketogulonate reductase-like aldo/keto reductase
MLSKRSSHLKNLVTLSRRQFSLETSSTDSTSDSEGPSRVKMVIDPLRGQYTDFLRHVGVYEESNQDSHLVAYYLNQGQRLKGYATQEGTEKYYRMSQYGEVESLDVHHENFRSMIHNEMLKVSSLGIGTYMGNPDDHTDFDMYNAIKTSVLSGGVNHIDTAPNYRYMKSEKTVGKILTVLEQKYEIHRDQLFVTSKGGYVPEDADNLISQREMINKLVNEVKVPEESIVKESGHCLHPKFLDHQLNETLQRLNLETLDVYYLHNPYEGQGPFNTDPEFFDRLSKAFEFLEKAVQDGRIRDYGMATYSCFRVKPSEKKLHLNL